MKWKKLLVLLLLVGVVFSLNRGLAFGSDLIKLKVTIPVVGITFYPLYVAQDKGFFKGQGCDFEIIVTQGDGPDVDALIAGNVEFCITPPHRALSAYEQGKKLLIVANLMNRIGTNGFMNKEIANELGITEKSSLTEKIKKLKGLTVGCTRPGAFTYHQAVHYVKRGGYVPQKDVQIVGAGGAAAMLASVEAKKVAIGFIASPAPEQAVYRGKSIMWVNLQKAEDPEFSEILFETLYVRPEYARENPEIVRRVVKALVQAMDYIVKGPDAEHIALMRARFSGTDDEPLLESLRNLRASLRPDGIITQKSMDANVKFLREAGLIKTDIPWTAVATNEFLPK